MAAPMVAMAGISAIGGFMSSRSSRREMKRMRQLMEKQLEFAKEQWQHYRDTYGNLEQQMVADAMYGTQGDFEGARARAAADVEGAFRSEREELDRRNMAYGLNPNSGRFQSSNRRAGLAQATASAMAENNARETERRRVVDDTWNRRSQMGMFGAGMMQQGFEGVQRAGMNLGRVYESAANQKGQLANNLFANAGMMGMYGMMSDKASSSDAPNAPGLSTPYTMDTGFDGGKNYTMNTGLPTFGNSGGVNMNAGAGMNGGWGFNQGLTNTGGLDTNYSMRF